ncbi:cytochrome P450 [Novosphingobium bradum]|uniref:Cytochrome P450 n=1 Tax=Novosphingobium bradum TaxID=1737444 RepID=A0ABV7ISL1_9SPHN
MSDTHAVELTSARDRALFNPEDEAAASGRLSFEPYPRLLELAGRGPALRGSLHGLMGIPPQGMAGPWSEADSVTAFSFAAVNKVFMDNVNFSNKAYQHTIGTALGETLLTMDGLAHRRMRDIAKPYFKPSFAEGWWNDKWIVQAVDALFDRITAKDHADLNVELCGPLPVSVVSTGFGLPMAQILPFRQAVEDALHGPSPEVSARAGQTLAEILLTLIARRRVDPQDDLISRFVTADLETDEGPRKLDDAEILRYCTLIVFAGGGTTWRQLGITIKALLDHPDQLEALRADRSLLRPTIQEATRWYPTDPLMLRWVEQDTELEGLELKAGSGVYLCMATANRDPAMWDDPDIFNIHRPVKRHFAFGAGVHACLGQHLSRQEMEVALGAMLDRLPNLRWDPDQPAARIAGGGLVGRGPNALHVRFDPG